MPHFRVDDALHSHRATRLFWCQELADSGDNGYFPEFLYPDDPPAHWTAVSSAGQWFVYVIYNKRVQNPLYVGYSRDVARRLTQHRQQKSWWPLVDQITVGLCDSRDKALEEERCRIAMMKPLFNVVGNRHG